MEIQYSWLAGDLLHASVCWNVGSDTLGELGSSGSPDRTLSNMIPRRQAGYSEAHGSSWVKQSFYCLLKL